MAEDRTGPDFSIYGVFLCAQERLMRKEYWIRDLRKEYPGYTGDEKWMIITDLTEEMLMEREETREILHCSVVVSYGMGKAMRKFEDSERKHSRRKKTHEISLECLNPEDEYVAAIADTDISWLSDLLDELPDKQKRRIRCRFIEGMTVKEIAEKERCSRQSVSGSIRHGLRTLRAMLENDMDD